MSDPFQAALEAMFNGPGSETALYSPVDGVPLPVRMIRRGPDRPTRYGDVQVFVGTHVVDILRSEVAQPVTGARIVTSDLDLTITIEPIPDVEGLTWTCGAEATA